MKKIFMILTICVVPFFNVNAQNYFETKSGIRLNEETINFIKEFGYSEKMIYQMTEEELDIFIGADINSASITKIEYPNPDYFKLPKVMRDSTMDTTYKTITGSLFYNSSYNRYQFFASIDFISIPSDSKKNLDFLFLNWGSGTKNDYKQATGYYERSNGEVVLFSEVTSVNPTQGKYGWLEGSSLSSSVTGIAFFIPKNKGVVDAVIGIARGFSNQPTSTKVENLEQYFTTPIINQTVMIAISESNNRVIINNSTVTNQLTRYLLNVTLRED